MCGREFSLGRPVTPRSKSLDHDNGTADMAAIRFKIQDSGASAGAIVRITVSVGHVNESKRAVGLGTR